MIINMRPRILNLKDGVVSLKGFPKETADKLAEYIKAFEQPAVIMMASSSGIEVKEPVVQEAAKPQIALASSASMSQSALGLHKDGLKISLVTVAYDLDTLEGKVIKVDKCDNRRDASVKFKTKAVELDFV